MSYYGIFRRVGSRATRPSVPAILSALILATACNERSIELSTGPRKPPPEISGNWLASVRAAYPHRDRAAQTAGTCSISDFQFTLGGGVRDRDSVLYAGSQKGISMLCVGAEDSARAVFGMSDTVVVILAGQLSGRIAEMCWIFEGCSWHAHFRFAGFHLTATVTGTEMAGQLVWSDNAGVPRVEGLWNARR